MIKEKDDIQDLMARCYGSTRVTAKTLFPERFFAPFTSLHEQIFDLIDSGAPRIAIAAPRGIGKTSIVGLALAGKEILFRSKKFLVYVSNSATSAEMQTENLKMELASNTIIRELFGPIKTKNVFGVNEMFSKKTWITSGGTLVLPRGSGQQIRGVLYGNNRPDLIVIDDLEDTETIENKDVRRKRKDWFTADLLKSVSRLNKNWQIVYIDTLKHEDALLQDLIDSSDWESLRLEICDDNYKSLVPEFMSDEEVMREVEYHRNQGQLDVFYREFRNMPVSKEDAVFMPSYFKQYNETDKEFRKIVHELENIVIVDPAKTVKLHSAESAIVGIGFHSPTGTIYVRDVVADKFHPDELYEEMFRMGNSLNARVLGVEVTSLNEFITQPIKNEMLKRGTGNSFSNFIELKARAKKEDRIAALVPYYRQGYVYHNENCCGGLEAQLAGFPRSKRFDIMDALAYVLEMLELGSRYHEPPESDEEQEEMDYAELEKENDEPVEGWRIAV